MYTGNKKEIKWERKNKVFYSDAEIESEKDRLRCKDKDILKYNEPNRNADR